MHHKAIRTLGCAGKFCGVLASSVLVSSVLVSSVLVSCAGGDTPARDSEVVGAIGTFYGSGSGSVGGSTGNGGSAGSGMAGSGMAGSGMAGADNTGGSGSGQGGSDVVGGGGGSGCDGFAFLQMNCGSGSFCHGAGSEVSGFAESEATAADFVGADASSGGQCASNGPVFDVDNPGNSLVVLKMTPDAPCGGPMPLGATSLPSAEDIECVEEWIRGL